MRHSLIAIPRFRRAVGLLTAVFVMFLAQAACAELPGMIGVGTWATQAEFKDIKVTQGDKVLFASDFSKGLEGWKTTRGKWAVVDGALRQTSNDDDARAIVGDPSWNDYTLTLKARKISGNEGFLILFGLPDERFKSWWNVGGWGNTVNALEVPGLAAERLPGKIETGRWYDIKVELSGNTVRVYLDNQLVQTATQTPLQRDFGHALVPDLVADPSIVEFDGTFYCYATTDGDGHGLATSGLPVVWKSKDFLNWHFSGSIFADNFDAKYWAPSAPILKDGKYYLFPTLDHRITAVVADQPEGPFRTLDGKDINKASGWKQFPIKVGHPIDAEILRDDDGSYYMAWSQRFIAKLNADFSAFDGEPQPIRTKRGGYSEGPALLKRNGWYYYLYTLGGGEGYQYAYMMSQKSPMGPWEGPREDIIATSDNKLGVSGPGHGCFFKPSDSDQWYFIHLEYGRGGTNRHILATKMNFNPDGTIQPIQLSLDGVGALRADPDYATPNLAARKQATVSSTAPLQRIPSGDPHVNRIEEFGENLALDESNGSRWMARSNDAQAWYQLDLGEARDIQRTELYFVQPTRGHAYKLEYSLDGQSWQTYGGHDHVIVQSPQVDRKSAQARYLKLTILKGTPGLWEFRVY